MKKDFSVLQDLGISEQDILDRQKLDYDREYATTINALRSLVPGLDPVKVPELPPKEDLGITDEQVLENAMKDAEETEKGMDENQEITKSNYEHMLKMIDSMKKDEVNGI
jgi:hypothetical protein